MKSVYDSYRDVSKDTYLIGLIGFSSQQANNSEEKVGLLIIETLDEMNNYVAYCIGTPFETNANYDITSISERVEEVAYTQHWLLSKADFDKSFLGKKINGLASVSNLNMQQIQTYSYQRAEQLLMASFNIDANPLEMFENVLENTPIHWNPFSRLIESNVFRLARLHRSSLWERIEDTFFVLNGRFFQTNELGLLDYLFPLPRLLRQIMLAIYSGPDDRLMSPQQRAIAWLLILESIKTIASVLLTVLVSPLVGLVHAGFSLYKSLKKTDKIETIMVKPMKGTIENSHDVNDDDFLAECTLSSFAKIYPQLNIKPIAKNKGLRDDMLSDNQSIIANHADLMLGAYTDETLRAVIEINDTNKPGIFALMEENQFHIDEYCERAGVMQQALTMVS